MLAVRCCHAARSLVPDGEPDIKFAVALGLAIMLDKPIIAIVMPGRDISTRLRRAADAVIYADLDTEQGQRHVAGRLKKVMAEIEPG